MDCFHFILLSEITARLRKLSKKLYVSIEPVNVPPHVTALLDGPVHDLADFAVVVSTCSPSLNALADPLSTAGILMPAVAVPIDLIADHRLNFRAVVMVRFRSVKQTIYAESRYRSTDQPHTFRSSQWTPHHV